MQRLDELQSLHIPPVSEQQTFTSSSRVITNDRHLRTDMLGDESYPLVKMPPRQDSGLRHVRLVRFLSALLIFNIHFLITYGESYRKSVNS